MLRNIACRYSQDDVKEILDSLGLNSKFDFIYIPRSLTRQSNLGYAFVNFKSIEYAEECCQLCDDRPFGQSSTLKLCKVVPAHVQGGIKSILGSRRKGKNKSRADPLLINDHCVQEVALMDALELPAESAHDVDTCDADDSALFDPVDMVNKLLDLPESEGEELLQGGTWSEDGTHEDVMLPTQSVEEASGSGAASGYSTAAGTFTSSSASNSEEEACEASAAGSNCGGEAGTAAKEEEGSTTVMLRNIACLYFEEGVMQVLDELGFQDTYDLIYVPRSPTRQSNLGYAFVNFTKPEYVEECMRICDGKPFGQNGSTKICRVALARVQGAEFANFINRRKGKKTEGWRSDGATSSAAGHFKPGPKQASGATEQPSRVTDGAAAAAGLSTVLQRWGTPVLASKSSMEAWAASPPASWLQGDGSIVFAGSFEGGAHTFGFGSDGGSAFRFPQHMSAR